MTAQADAAKQRARDPALPGELGIVGLGRIGGQLARQALDKGLRVVGYRRHRPEQELLDAGLDFRASVAELAGALAPPRLVYLSIPAGPPLDALLDELGGALAPGDLVMDGGNSYWGDSVRRHARMKERGLRFLDVGTSGGLPGAREGACFMVGGEPEAVARVEPLLRALAVPGGFVHCGGPGTGHFVKLVHNGVEFGMLQALGEGLALLRRFPQALPVEQVLQAWQHGSVVRSWLLELLVKAWREEGGVAQVAPFVEDTGEVSWLLEDALRLEVPVPVISQSVMALLLARDTQRDWARAVAMMRHGFGAHPYGEAEAVARERASSRVDANPPLPLEGPELAH
jgi:6-phosphogluconate dehydrogenase